MVIIVEGIDRVGKTTFCNMLSKELGIPILKKDRIGEDYYTKEISAYMTYGNALGIVEMANKDLLKDVIIDRFHWTEAVYGVVNRNCMLSQDLMCTLEYKMDREKFLVVYVKPVDIKMSEEQHGSSLSKHLELYNHLKSKRILRVIETDYNSLEKTVKDIKEKWY